MGVLIVAGYSGSLLDSASSGIGLIVMVVPEAERERVEETPDSRERAETLDFLEAIDSRFFKARKFWKDDRH